jgi:hypothetical protein
MSQFYDLASLVVIPSGYKASTIYAQKPLTTDGQLSFSRASTATRVNASGLIEAVASNVPRLDYLGSSCPRLLLEPQRTNLATYSEQFDNAAWNNAGGAVVSANTAVAPDGTTTADTATFGAGSEILRQIITSLTPSVSYTFTAYVKKSATSGANNVRLTINNTLSWSGAVSTKIALTNNWQRVSLTWTSAANAYLIIGSLDQNGTDDTSCYGNVDIWGAQLEAGAYATSYVKTEAAAVTRVADAASKTGISSLIGQTEGTIFWEGSINTLGDFPQICDLNADGNKFIQIYNTLVGGLPRLALYVQNVTILLNASNIAGLSFNTIFKLALGYKNNDYALYLNGVQVYVNTTIGVPPTSNFGLGKALQSAEGSGKEVAQAALFPTRLTNAQLAEITTL